MVHCIYWGGGGGGGGVTGNNFQINIIQSSTKSNSTKLIIHTLMYFHLYRNILRLNSNYLIIVIIYSYFMPVCSIVKTITPRCRGRPDALLHEAEGRVQ